jgi:hypothetical protein
MTVGPGRKDDGGKLRVDLLPIGALQEVAKVLTFGADKYGANNWQNVSPRSRYYGAALRHLWARARGGVTDPESGLPHLAHAACCILFLLSAEAGFDDPEAWEDDAEPADEPEIPALKVDDRVRILVGPFKDRAGRITRVDAHTDLPLRIELDGGVGGVVTFKNLDEVEPALKTYYSAEVTIDGVTLEGVNSISYGRSGAV